MEFSYLRQQILTKAITGRLVEQLDSEPEVEQIGSAPDQDEVPFDIPAKWKWVRLEQVCTYIQRGKSPKYSNIKQLPVVAQKCNQWDGLHMELSLFADPVTIPSYKPERFLQQDDILLNSTGTGTLGRVGSYDEAVNPYKQAVADSHVTVIRVDQAIANPQFVKYMLRSSVYQELILKSGSGSTKQQELALAKVKQLLTPLPPLEEQRRIVAVVDDLFARLTAMEAAYSDLTGPMSEHFRNLVLQKAVNGQLVPQLDSEPEVEQVGPAPDQDKVPFDIPAKWRWVRMSSLADSIRYGYTASAAESGNAKFLRITDIQKGQVNWDTVPFCKIDNKDLNNLKLEVNDILIARSGSVGKSFVVDCIDNDHEAVFASYLIRIRVKDDVPVITNYIKHYLNSPFYWQSITQSARGTSQLNVNAKHLGNLLLPLPPLAEQRRIVAKIEELFAGVDKLGSLKDFA